MMISFTCPHCGKQTNVADQFAGQTGPCAGCGQNITIPGSAFATPTLAAPPVNKSMSGTTIALIIVGCILALCVCGGLPALLLPAVQASREASRRVQCSNNLKQISLALLNYHDVYKSYPPAYIADENGRPMHSWRVLILPFLEQQALYARYDFSKPWNDPANQAVTSVPIRTYMCASNPGSPGAAQTHYMVVTGPGAVFEGAKAIGMAEIRDGTSNTLMVVEVANSNVNWAEPKDLDLSQFTSRSGPTPPNSAGSYHPGGFMAAMCDGSVRFIANATPIETLRAMVSRAGGEAVQLY